jgi:hypothetical protein
MAGTPSEENDNSRPTVAGCLLMLVSLAVIGAVAIPVVTWRDPEDGQPMPKMVAILTPVLAGALCYGIGTAILKVLGLPVLVPSKKQSSERPEDEDTSARDEEPGG